MRFLEKLFKIVDIDSHYHIFIFGVHICAIKYSRHIEVSEVVSIGIEKSKDRPLVIASLTSFPDRVYEGVTSKTISTLFKQTQQPNKLVLWLSEDQFPGRSKCLPKDVLQLQDFGLDINWVDDIKSYKKLIPALQCFPDDIIITFDDDIYYARDSIESLYASYLSDKNNVHAHRCGRIAIRNGELKSVSNCYLYDKKYPASFYNRLTGYGGVLYPPHVFDQRIFSDYMDILPTHDDVWFWGMLVLNNIKTQVVKGYSESIYTIENSQQFGLCKVNNVKCGLSIDGAYKKMTTAFPEIIDKLRSEEI